MRIRLKIRRGFCLLAAGLCLLGTALAGEAELKEKRLELGGSYLSYQTVAGMEEETNLTNGYSVHLDSVAWDPAFVKAAFSVNNVGGSEGRTCGPGAISTSGTGMRSPSASCFRRRRQPGRHWRIIWKSMWRKS